MLATIRPAELRYRLIFRKVKPYYTFAGVIVLSILPCHLRAAARPERSVSPSGQFIIYGDGARSRGAISNLAERIKTDVLALLRRRDAWTTPVVINLQSRAANLPEAPANDLRFSQTGSGLKLQLDLTLSREIDPSRIGHELMRAILLEMIYRNQTAIPVGENYVESPPWLMEGLLASIPNRGSASLTEALSATDRTTSFDRFLREQPELLDSAGRLLHRAYSSALVQLLIEQDDGRARLGRYIDNLAFAPNNPMSDLQTAFPGLAESGEIWKSKIGSLRKRIELLTFSQAEEKLTQLLRMKFPSPDGREKLLSLEDLCQKKLTRAEQVALQKFVQELVLLAGHANPVLRPVFEDYQQIATQLALGKSHGAAARLAELKGLRARLVARMSEIDDYLNWFEATQLSAPSRLFDDYLKFQAEAETSSRHRTDPLSVYLDAVESEF